VIVAYQIGAVDVTAWTDPRVLVHVGGERWPDGTAEVWLGLAGLHVALGWVWDHAAASACAAVLLQRYGGPR